jgi:hypothetical protein
MLIVNYIHVFINDPLSRFPQSTPFPVSPSGENPPSPSPLGEGWEGGKLSFYSSNLPPFPSRLAGSFALSSFPRGSPDSYREGRGYKK